MQNIVFIDNRVSDGICELIRLHGAEVIRLPSFWGLSSPVSSHSDMLMSKLPDGRIITSREYYSANVAMLEKYGEHFVLTDDIIRPNYPDDVVFDAFSIGEKLFGHKNKTSKALRNFYKEFIPVKQGYARCSVAFPSDKCAITSDRALYEILISNGIDSLLISYGGICLDGYDYGFIGGSSGVLPDGTFIMFGDPSLHPDGEKIIEFLNKNKIKKEVIKGLPLYDFGGLTYLSI